MSGLPAQTAVLIVGAGPTGLTLGISLRQRGVGCILIDKLPAALPWSRALGLHARTLEIFDALGVLDAVSARSLVQKAVHVHGERGPLFQLDLTVLDAPHPQVLSCPQAEVDACLEDRFTALGGMLVRGCELLDFTQDDTGVQARLAWAAGEHTLRAAIMVGCDGASSRVRHVLGISFDGVRYADHFLLADVDIDWPLARDASHGFLLAEGALIALPMPRGWRLIINQSEDDDLEPVPDLAPFRQRLAQCLEEPPTLGEPRWLSRFSIHRRLAGRYRRNRVLLAGDACHIQSPLGAQGMNTGIGDAFNLGWKLALFLRGVGGGALLDSYEQERRPVARQMLNAVDVLSRSSFARAAPLRGMRDTLLKLVGRQQGFGARLLRRASQLDVHYRQSPMVGEGSGMALLRRPAGPLPGDRVPDAPLTPAAGGMPGRVHDMLRDTRHQLLIQVPAVPDHAAVLTLFALATRLPQDFGECLGVQVIAAGDWPAALNELRAYPMTLWCDRDGAFRHRFGDGGHLWLMRPDGHLAYRAPLDDADELVGWLTDHFRRRSNAPSASHGSA